MHALPVNISIGICTIPSMDFSSIISIVFNHDLPIMMNIHHFELLLNGLQTQSVKSFFPETAERIFLRFLKLELVPKSLPEDMLLPLSAPGGIFSLAWTLDMQTCSGVRAHTRWW